MLGSTLLSGLMGCGAVVGPGLTRDASLGDGAALDDRPTVSFEVPIICVTPDGRQFAPGSTIVVGPCNATCSCDFNGQVTCNPGECPPPASCRAPDGSEIPVGGNWTSPDRCTTCSCPAPGLPQCARDLNCPQPNCNDVAPPNALVNPRVVSANAPVGTGGVIRDGNYQLTQYAIFIPPNDPSPMLAPLGVNVVIRGNQWQSVSSPAGQSLQRNNFSAMVTSPSIVLMTNCGTSPSIIGTFTETAQGFTLFSREASRTVLYGFSRQ